jgi:YidC/Oxa1 family membrane protein insertase
MESQRLILIFVFMFSVFMLLDAWQRDRQPAGPPPAAQPDKMDKAGKADPAGKGALSVPATPIAGEKPVAQASAPQAAAPRSQGKTIRVETDLVVAHIGTLGGNLQRLELKQHRDTLDKAKPFILLDAAGEHAYFAQSGLTGGKLPNHHTLFQSAEDTVQLADGSGHVEVRLRAPEADGVQVTKVYRFSRGSYLIDVSFEIVNKGTAPIEPWAYFHLVRNSKPPAGDSAMLPTFTGFAVYTAEEKFRKITFEEIDKGKAAYPKESKDGWIAILQHYFLGSWLPKNGALRTFYIERTNGEYRAGLKIPAGSIAPGSTATATVPLYAGPQEQEELAEIAPGLDLTIDYGWLTVIAVPLFWLLKMLNKLVGNWGVAIIILTIIIKLLFYPLSAASYRSMAKMRVVAPKLQRMKDLYGDDRQRMQQAMMDLYKTEKINPLGGCMPIVVQIPVFIALYWVLLASVELRHAPFFLWIHDLAAPDALFGVWFGMPIGLLPILMAGTMWIQTKLNPEPPDPVQAKVMKIMPLVFSVFFFFFPAGLVLYWLVNNVLSIAQQWQITRAMGRESAAARKN